MRQSTHDVGSSTHTRRNFLAATAITATAALSQPTTAALSQPTTAAGPDPKQSSRRPQSSDCLTGAQSGTAAKGCAPEGGIHPERSPVDPVASNDGQ